MNVCEWKRLQIHNDPDYDKVGAEIEKVSNGDQPVKTNLSVIYAD